MTASTSQMTSLFDIIAWVESKNNPHAMRFEPATFDRIRATMLNDGIVRRIAYLNACSFGTAAMIYSTSWGATQIMGFNLYADNLTTAHHMTVVDFMNDSVVQAAVFSDFCAKNGMAATVQDLAQFPVLRLHFAKLYNGPGAPEAYAAQIVYALQHFGIEVTQ